MADLRPGDHLCCICETDEEHGAVVTPFLRHGLERRERVIYIPCGRTDEAIWDHLRDDGFDVEPYRRSGQLSTLSPEGLRSHTGRLDPDRMIGLLLDETRRALDDGYAALRVVGEMAWAVDEGKAAEGLIECEARLNEILPGSKCLMLCQYDRLRFRPEVLLSVLQTHPEVAIGAERCRNPYYVPPKQFMAGSAPADTLGIYLSHLADRARWEREDAARPLQNRLRALQEAHLDLSRAGSFEELCRRAVELGCKCLGFDRLGVWMVDEKDRGYVESLCGVDAAGCIHGASGRRLHVAHGSVWADILANKTPLVHEADAPLGDGRGGKAGRGERLVAALFNGTQAIGFLSADNLLSRRPVADHQRELLTVYANMLGHLSTRQRLVEQLRRHGEDLEDLVEQRTAELRARNEDLHRARRDWEEIFQAIGQPTLILDTDHNILMANRAVVKAVGKPAEELLNKRCCEVLHGTKEPPPECPMEKMLRSGHLETVEMQIEALEGAFLVSCTPLPDQAGRLTRVMHIATDITDRKRLEEQLLHAQRMESVGTLAGGVAHNFNNILGIILGNAELLKMELDKSHIAGEFPERIIRATERAAVLTQRLLSLARQGSGERGTVSISALITRTAESLRGLLDSNIRVECRVADALPHVHANIAEIEQVLMNVCLNARDAMPKGGTIAMAVDAVDLSAQFCAGHERMKPGAHLKISIRDTGMGMDSDTLGRIFDPFFTTKGPDKGIGLGLAMAYGIVRAHHGCIEAKSKPGEGTEVCIYLPAAPDKT